MRLFFQLSEAEKEAVFDDFVGQVIMDILENNLNIDDTCTDISKKREELLKLVEDANMEDDETKKISMLIENEDMHDVINHFAMQMATNAFYHEPGEIVVYPHTLVEDGSCSHCEDYEEDNNEMDDLELPDIEKKKNKNNVN